MPRPLGGAAYSMPSWTVFSYDTPQQIMAMGTNFTLPPLSKKARAILFSDSLVIPAYVVLASAIFLLLHIILVSPPVKKLYARLSSSASNNVETINEPPNPTSSISLSGEIREHIASHGGSTIFAFKVARLAGCLTLLGLSIATAILNEGVADLLGKKKHPKKSRSPALSATEWLELAMCVTYLYASLLALVSVSTKSRWSKLATRHVNLLMLATFGVYAYRDLFPFATLYKQPLDIGEGKLLWAKLVVLTITAVVIPLFIPRQYIPVDPKDPRSGESPEQVASIWSMMTYSFLDPIVLLANRVPHLSHDQLPPLADHDFAKNLKNRSFKHLDTFAGAKRRHIFWGLMRVFGQDYLVLAVMITSYVVLSFAAPIGIKQLLGYLETGGQDAWIRPWVWIVWLFIGPTVGSMTFQWYIYIATRALVRCECIITELVFEHSLRIRMKAETTSTSQSVPATPLPLTPDNASELDAQPSTSSSPEATESTERESRSETVRASSSSVKSGTSTLAKGKDKGKSAETTEVKAPETTGAKNLIGKINNLVTTDLGNIIDSRDFLFTLLYMPLQIVLCITFLYAVLGWSAFVGLVVMLLLFPIPGYVANQVRLVQVSRLKVVDARVQTVTEAMNVLRMIKLFGWERKMNEKIAEKRDEELIWLWKRQVLDLVNGNLNFVIPVITMMATYSTYVRTVIMKENLSASKVFSSMMVFDMLRDQMHLVLYSVTQTVQGKVSLDRVNEFLHDTELLDSFRNDTTSPALFDEHSVPPSDVIGFRDATFKWSSESDGTVTPSRREFLLRIEDEVYFKHGRFNLIIGPTGSGKTSLLMALLGEMHFVPSGPDSWFNLPRGGGIAYAAQESWVQNETIKDNIVFGAEFDEERYKKVLYQCCLERDISLFDAGDATEVGEKGLTLSGGQKARITLARAIYSRAEIILLDDVLAALDVHTAKWIVEKCFSGDLVRGRTVILVTHNVAMARPIAEFVVSLGTDGRVVAKGSVEEVLERDSEIKKEIKADEAAIERDNEALDQKPAGAEVKQDGKLIVAEEIEEGHVSWNALKLYFLGLGGKHPYTFFAAFFVGLLMTELTNVSQTWFLGYWASQYDTHAPEDISTFYYLGVYGGLLTIAVIIYCLSYVVYIYGVQRASRSLHKQLLESVLGTTLRWLDITPTSRVIARCTQDIRAIDGPIAVGLWWLSEMTCSMLIKFAAVVVLTPVFLFPGVLVAGLGGWCGQIYIAAQLAVKREMSNAKAPVLGHFGAAIAGLVSIRAYGSQTAFIQESLHRIDRYTRSARSFYNLNRWICVRIDAIGGLFAAGLATYLVYFQSHTAANTGFSLNMAVGFSSMILWWVRVFNDFEVQGNSLERIQGYINIEQEPKPEPKGVPPAYWPASGDIRVEKLSAKYSVDGPKVLHDISFELKSGERIGVVGRTGSGKSSLTLSLLRCILTEGEVYFDGLKTSEVNLDALRSNITIIPQVPELLSGSLRQNLDPFDQYDDPTLNDALRAAGLFALQSEMDEGRITLDSAISSGGSNLSVGQRQILALARAIVRGSKLLILDEATSAIDYKTDSVIQSSLRNELRRDVTLITVAHRLQTIMDADKIMVLDAGRLVEFDSPKELLKNKTGLLRSLVDESGDRATLYTMAGTKP